MGERRGCGDETIGTKCIELCCVPPTSCTPKVAGNAISVLCTPRPPSESVRYIGINFDCTEKLNNPVAIHRNLLALLPVAAIDSFFHICLKMFNFIAFLLSSLLYLYWVSGLELFFLAVFKPCSFQMSLKMINVSGGLRKPRINEEPTPKLSA